MALMRGAEWTPARALGSATTVRLDRAMLDPGDAVAIRIGQMFALDEKLNAKLTASISLLKLRGDETVKDLKTLDSVDPDLMTLKEANSMLDALTADSDPFAARR